MLFVNPIWRCEFKSEEASLKLGTKKFEMCELYLLLREKCFLFLTRIALFLTPYIHLIGKKSDNN